MPYVSMATGSPAINWACRYCNLDGVWIAELDSVVYPGGAARVLAQLPRRTATQRRLLNEWRRRFRGTPHIVAALVRPDYRRDHAFRMRAGKLSEEAKLVSEACYKRCVEAGGYHGTDCFSRSRAGMDVGRQCVEDQMHQIGNTVKAGYCLMLDVSKDSFTEKRRNAEVVLERFPELRIYTETDQQGLVVLIIDQFICTVSQSFFE